MTTEVKTGTQAAEATPAPPKERTVEELQAAEAALKRTNEGLVKENDRMRIREADLLATNRDLNRTLGSMRGDLRIANQSVQDWMRQARKTRERVDKLGMQILLGRQAAVILATIAGKGTDNLRALTTQVVEHLKSNNFDPEEVLVAIKKIMAGATELTVEKVVEETMKPAKTDGKSVTKRSGFFGLLDSFMGMRDKEEPIEGTGLDCARCATYDTCDLPHKIPLHELRPGRA